MSLDCLCAGILVADHLCTPIARLPDAGELVLADRLELNVGGCASNAAIDLARVGVQVGIAGCVGNDAFGHFLGERLAAADVDTTGLRYLDNVHTSGTLIVNVAGQDRRFIHSVGANAHFTVDCIDLEIASKARVFYVGGYLLMESLRPGPLAELFKTLRQRGVRTVLDVVHPGKLDAWEWLEPVLAHTDVFLPNHDEARLITGLSDPREQALRLSEAGAATVVVTCGGDGSVLVSKDLRLVTRGYQFQVVGATGAGDAFDAGYIAGMLQDADPRQCLAWGSALGGSCVRAISATESVFTRDEAERYIAEHPLQVETW